ncbi:Gp19/Gp15/Gp42 family protein [Nakamurella lactea]|uniref:Gp19/Gp15/Gp42 family protein n=1 Tax=Nakamurella lactea TaxID=459515 RepID=UPI00048B005B|nr:Gp19/Gp15/Gp42 family protein [Nakamurella lactea]
MAIAQPEEVARRLGREFSASETDQAGALLDDIELEISLRVPDFASRLTNDVAFAEVVGLLEVRAVRRVMLNPLGVRQRSDSVDDHTESETLDPSIASSGLYLTDAEWAMLIPGQTAGTVQGSGGYA